MSDMPISSALVKMRQRLIPNGDQPVRLQGGAGSTLSAASFPKIDECTKNACNPSKSSEECAQYMKTFAEKVCKKSLEYSPDSLFEAFIKWLADGSWIFESEPMDQSMISMCEEFWLSHHSPTVVSAILQRIEDCTGEPLSSDVSEDIKSELKKIKSVPFNPDRRESTNPRCFQFSRPETGKQTFSAATLGNDPVDTFRHQMPVHNRTDEGAVPLNPYSHVFVAVLKEINSGKVVAVEICTVHSTRTEVEAAYNDWRIALVRLGRECGLFMLRGSFIVPHRADGYHRSRPKACRYQHYDGTTFKAAFVKTHSSGVNGAILPIGLIDWLLYDSITFLGKVPELTVALLTQLADYAHLLHVRSKPLRTISSRGKELMKKMPTFFGVTSESDLTEKLAFVDNTLVSSGFASCAGTFINWVRPANTVDPSASIAVSFLTGKIHPLFAVHLEPTCPGDFDLIQLSYVAVLMRSLPFGPQRSNSAIKASGVASNSSQTTVDVSFCLKDGTPIPGTLTVPSEPNLSLGFSYLTTLCAQKAFTHPISKRPCELSQNRGNGSSEVHPSIYAITSCLDDRGLCADVIGFVIQAGEIPKNVASHSAYVATATAAVMFYALYNMNVDVYPGVHCASNVFTMLPATKTALKACVEMIGKANKGVLHAIHLLTNLFCPKIMDSEDVNDNMLTPLPAGADGASSSKTQVPPVSTNPRYLDHCIQLTLQVIGLLQAASIAFRVNCPDAYPNVATKAPMSAEEAQKFCDFVSSDFSKTLEAYYKAGLSTVANMLGLTKPLKDKKMESIRNVLEPGTKCSKFSSTTACFYSYLVMYVFQREFFNQPEGEAITLWGKDTNSNHSSTVAGKAVQLFFLYDDKVPFWYSGFPKNLVGFVACGFAHCEIMGTKAVLRLLAKEKKENESEDEEEEEEDDSDGDSDEKAEVESEDEDEESEDDSDEKGEANTNSANISPANNIEMNLEDDPEMKLLLASLDEPKRNREDDILGTGEARPSKQARL